MSQRHGAALDHRACRLSLLCRRGIGRTGRAAGEFGRKCRAVFGGDANPLCILTLPMQQRDARFSVFGSMESLADRGL